MASNNEQAQGRGDIGNPFDFKAMFGSIVATVGLPFQMVTRPVLGASKIIGFGALGVGAIDVIAGTFGASGFGAVSGSALSTLGIPTLLSNIGLTAAAAFPPLALVGGLFAAAIAIGYVTRKIDSSIGAYTGMKGDKTCLVNPLRGIANTFETVGAVGKFAGNLIARKGGLAVLTATGLLTAEIAGMTLAGASWGAATGGIMGGLANIGIWGAGTLAAAPALGVILGLAAAGYVVAKIGKYIDKGSDRIANLGDALDRSIFKSKGGPVPSPA